jgi:hypothetical protein
MKLNHILILSLVVLTNGLSSGEVLPRIFKESTEFILIPTDGVGENRTLVESEAFGEKKLNLLTLSPGGFKFVMGAPQLDSCGFIHFLGNSVLIEERNDVDGKQYRFYETSIVGDVFCEPNPFPRCGASKTTVHQAVTPYLKELLSKLGVACYFKILDGERLIQTYQIQQVRSLRDAQF